MGITHFWSATLNWFRSHASSETKTCRHQERRTAKPLTRLDCGGYPMSMPAIEATAVLHKRPQKLTPLPPGPPSPIASGQVARSEKCGPVALVILCL